MSWITPVERPTTTEPNAQPAVHAKPAVGSINPDGGGARQENDHQPSARKKSASPGASDAAHPQANERGEVVGALIDTSA